MFSKLIILLHTYQLIRCALLTRNDINLDVLNKNLFESLTIHPKFDGQNRILTDDQKKFIDKYVDDYFELTMHAPFSFEEDSKYRKRSIIPKNVHSDVEAVHIFNGLVHLSNLEKYNFTKLEFFNCEPSYFVAALEFNNSENHDNLLIFKYENENLTASDKWSIPTVESFTILSRNPAFILVKADDEYYSGVWQFDGHDLRQIQNLDLKLVTEMKIWAIESGIFMALSYDGNSTTNPARTEIFTWLGGHFDSTQIIRRKNEKLTVFGVNHYSFLAIIVNNENQEFLEIYRYNLQDESHAIVQRIPTYKCTDVKFFSLKKDKGLDLYLTVANYLSGESHEEYPSIIFKYVEDYFLPFQNLNVHQVLEYFPVKDPENNKFLLVARTEFQNFITYQFDGWTFQRNVRNINEHLTEISDERPHNIFLTTELPIIIIQYYDNEVLELYKYEFVEENELKKIHNEILERCENSLKKLEDTNLKRPKRQTRTFEEIQQKMVAANSIIDELNRIIPDENNINNFHVFDDLIADEIVLDNLNTESMLTDTINNLSVDEIFRNKVDLNEDSSWNSDSKIEHVQIDSFIDPRLINRRSPQDLIQLNKNSDLTNLTVVGNIKLESPLTVQSLNRRFFNRENLLLKDLPQTFDDLSVDVLESRNLNPSDINGLSSVKSFDTRGNNVKKIENIDNLKVKRIVIGDFLNNVDMRTLNKYALKIFGDQEITGTYHFEDFRTNNIQVDTLSDKNLENFVRTDSGEFQLNYDVQFRENLETDQLTVGSFLDAVPVVNGELQVLLRDSEKIQRITSEKKMSEVELLTPISLQGNIQSDELNKINPVVSVDESFVFEGDFEIAGNTSIENIVKANDIISSSNHSAKKILRDGLLLREKEIDLHLNFEQQLNVDEIFIGDVNGMNPQEWVVAGTPMHQNIHGQKVFVDDVRITGNTNFFRINNIDCGELENSVLTRNSDQIISGKHTLSNVVSSNIRSNETFVGKTLLEDILRTDSEQYIRGTAVITSTVNSQRSSSENTKIIGSFNKINFANIVEDTVMKPIEKSVTGLKTFNAHNLSVSTLIVNRRNFSNPDEILIIDDVRLENVQVESIDFMKSCNGENRENFGGAEEVREITSKRTNFNKLVVLGDVHIESGCMNHANLEDFEKDTLKIDEDNQFIDNVESDGAIVCEESVISNGHIEKVDLENIVRSKSETAQIVLDNKRFRNNMSVFGKTTFKDLVNEFNMSFACNLASPDVEGKEIIISGNVVFTKGPGVNRTFNIPIKFVRENAWYKNEEKRFQRRISFENITAFNNITVEGLVDGVDLGALKGRYFSRTKNQTVTGGIAFGNRVKFAGNLIAPQITLNGQINDFKLSDLPRTLLLQGADQMFEEPVYLENVEVDNLIGEFKVNGFSLGSDLMLRDGENIVTGTKSFEKLQVGNVQIKDETKIQNIDVLDWMKNAVSKKGISNIDKKKIFRKNVEFVRGISLRGKINGEEFNNETVMLKRVPQNITGEKRFIVDKLDRMRVKNMKLKGLANNMEMTTLLNDHEENPVKNLIFKSPMNFLNDVHTKNLILKKPYEGVEFEQIIADIYSLYKADDLIENYAKLLNVSWKIDQNLRNQALYLQHYRELQELKNPLYFINSCCRRPSVIYFVIENGHYYMKHHSWDDYHGLFLKSDVRVDMGIVPKKIEIFTSKRHQVLYVEHPTGERIAGTFVDLDNPEKLIDLGSIISNGVREITPLVIDEAECILVIYVDESSPHILCGLNNKLHPYQVLEAPGRYVQSVSTKIDQVPYIFLIRTFEDQSWNLQGIVEIWSRTDSMFVTRQIIHSNTLLPQEIAAVAHKNVHYLSIIYHGNTLGGHVDILRLDVSDGNYKVFQKISLSNSYPVKAEFGVLPSNELMLFLQDSNTLRVYKYEGISGFTKKMVASGDTRSFKQFSIEKEHFVLVETNSGKLKILQGMFKGKL